MKREQTNDREQSMMPREHCGTFIKCNNAEGCQGCEYEAEQEIARLKDRTIVALLKAERIKSDEEQIKGFIQ